MIGPQMTPRSMLSARNAVALFMNAAPDLTDEMGAEGCDALNNLERAIRDADATNADDALVKLVSLAQVVAEGHEPTEMDAALAIVAAQKHCGIGYIDHHLMAEVRSKHPFALTCAPSQYRLAHDGYSSARARFMALPEDLETNDEPAFRREERQFLDAVDRLTTAEPGDCSEFVEWFLALTDNGASSMRDDAAGHAANVAKRLRGVA